MISVSQTTQYVLLLIIILLTLIPCTSSAALQDPFNPDISPYFDSIREDRDELFSFFYGMPKGGDIHIHLSGAVPPEKLMAIAARHNLLVDPATGQLVDPATDQPSHYTPLQPLVPVASAYANATLSQYLVSKWSMTGFSYENLSGHDWFFNTFDLIDPVTYYDGELIASIRDLAACENIRYLELMTSQTNSDNVKEIVSTVAWDENLTLMRENLLSAGLADICRQKVLTQANYDQISREHATAAGRNVTVRYNYEALRFYPKKEVFSDLLQAFEIANQSPIIEGITLVGDEADPYSLDDYYEHMKMLAYFHSIYPHIPITLHAGELTPEIVPPVDIQNHIQQAITIANATRIGHGVSIRYEADWEESLAKMADFRIPVEILMTSNLQILRIHARDHPVSLYMEYDIPVILATDDPGVECTTLTQEYVNFTMSNPTVTYEQIREINQNSIRYSFLPAPEKEEMLAELNESLKQYERNIFARFLVVPAYGAGLAA
jgi:adenosine deaminase